MLTELSEASSNVWMLMAPAVPLLLALRLLPLMLTPELLLSVIVLWLMEAPTDPDILGCVDSGLALIAALNAAPPPSAFIELCCLRVS